MKTKKFSIGKNVYKSYLKKVGNCYETGLVQGTNILFLGTFNSSPDGNKWYSHMNKEIERFAKRFWITKTTPQSFYKKFIGHHLTKDYYGFLTKCNNKKQREVTRNVNKETRKYNQLRKNMKRSECLPVRKRAA